VRILARREIYGVGVDLAVRLQALAPPGGVCLSSRVRDLLGEERRRVAQDLGEHSLEQLDEPIRAWCLHPDADGADGGTTSGASTGATAAAPAPAPGRLRGTWRCCRRG
jgi:adenylate cyclase